MTFNHTYDANNIMTWMRNIGSGTYTVEQEHYQENIEIFRGDYKTCVNKINELTKRSYKELN